MQDHLERQTNIHFRPFTFFPLYISVSAAPLILGLTGPTGETVRVHSPASVELHVRIEQGDDGGGGGSPATDSGPDQPFLLVVTDHFDEVRAVLTVGLVHKALQVLLQLRWTGGGTHKQTNKPERHSQFMLLKLIRFF